jgi:hypothetical protein
VKNNAAKIIDNEMEEKELPNHIDTSYPLQISTNISKLASLYQCNISLATLTHKTRVMFLAVTACSPGTALPNGGDHTLLAGSNPGVKM